MSYSNRCSYKTNISTEGALDVDPKEHFADSLTYSLGEFNQNNTTIPFQVWQTPIKDIFNKEWLDSLPHEVEPWCMVFYRDASAPFNKAHVDVTPYGKTFVCGLNFVLEPDDSEMIWYSNPHDVTNPRTFYNVDASGLQEIDRANIASDRLTLVRTDILHDVDNKHKERWCISLRPTAYETWDEAVFGIIG